MEILSSTLKQLAGFYESLSPARKAGLVFVSTLVVVVIIVIGMWAQDGEFVVLWKGIEPSEIQNVVNTLVAQKIPYQTQDNGTTLLVPKSKASELRINLTSAGITQGGRIVGFELFDRKSLGVTTYVQKINFKRALEGELVKSIRSIKGVEEARVHLVIPENKTFLVDQKQATASVIVKTFPGKVLGDNIILGISNLVASSVEGLEPENVVVLNDRGHLLSNNSADQVTKESNDQLQFKSRVEKNLEKRTKTILGRVVGEDNVEIKITADIDFTKEKLIQEKYDPDGAVLLSQVTMNEKFEGNKANPTGIPGSRSNLPGEENVVEKSGTSHTSDRNTETVNYNVSKQVINTEKPTAQIKKLSVSVLVNSEPVLNKDGKIENYEKRKDLKELEFLAKNALGFNGERGDSFTIESLPFKVETFEEADSFLKELTKNKLIRDLVFFGLIGATILLFFFFIIRPFLNWVIDKTSEGEDFPASIEDLESGNALATLKEKTLIKLDDSFNPEKAESEALIEKIRSLVAKNPAKAVGALKPWINNER